LSDRYLIVGVDPGTTYAFCAFDLKGNFVSAWSKRDAGKEEVVRALEEVGTPALFSTDKKKIPGGIEKIAARFNTRVWSPHKDLGENEKRELTKKYRFENVHEADAGAGALKALHSVENKLRQVERIAREKGFAKKIEYAKYLVLSGMRLSDVLELLEAEEKPVKKQEKPVQEAQGLPEVFEKRLAEKDERLRELLLTKMELKKRIEKLEHKNRELEQELARKEKKAYAELKRDNEIRKRDRIIRKLKHLLEWRKKKAGEKRKPSKSDLKKMNPKTHIDLDEIVGKYKDKRRVVHED